MSGENVTVYGTQKTLASSGSSCANLAIVQAATATYDRQGTDGNAFPDGEFVLDVTFATAPTEGAVIALYARPLDIDGTLDGEVPEAARPTVFVGTFTVNNVTTLQTIPLDGIFAQDLPAKADYYLYNNGTGQSISSGWVLKVTPRTYKAAP